VNLKNTLKSSVAVAALFAVAAPMTAEAGNITNGKTAKLAISGQIVKAITNIDDSKSSKTFLTDGAQTSSRLRWVASSKLSDSVTVGGAIEMNIPHSNAAASMTLGTIGADGVQSADSGWGIRHQYIYVSSKAFGKAYIGQTSSAADGSSEANYSGTGMFAGSGGYGHGQGALFVDTTTATNEKMSAIAVKSAISNMDHSSRTDVIRYDLPSMMGLKVKTSYQTVGDWDLGVEYNDSMDGFKMRVRAGFTKTASNATKNHIATGSLALGHESGLHAAFAAGKTNIGNPRDTQTDHYVDTKDTGKDGINDPHFYAVTLGYNAKMFGVGGTSFAANYNETKNNIYLADQDKNVGSSFSLQAVQTFKSVGTQVGIEWIHYEYESEAASTGTINTFADIDAVTLQTVFKF